MMGKRVAAVGLVGLLGLASANANKQDIALLREEVKTIQNQLDAQDKLVAERQAALTKVSSSRRLDAHLVTAEAFAAQQNDYNGALDSMWLCLCGALVMLMHGGFSMLETGCCRAKNAQNVLMKNLVNVTAGTLGWWIFGWAFAFGKLKQDGALENQFIGDKQFFGMDMINVKDNGVTFLKEGETQSTMLMWFFQWAFCTAGATIVSGGVAERVKAPTYGCYAFVMAAFIYPVVVAWTWGYGWLSTVFGVGFVDFAGSGVVHLTGGVSALAGTIVLGPRKGRFENPELFEAHSLPLVVLGTFILWFGWYGFNPGSTLGMHSSATGMLAAQIAMNTTLSAATAGLGVFGIRYALTRKYDVGGLCNGILAGLVSITAGCSNMRCGYAVLTGAIGALVYQGMSMTLQRYKIDDPVDASPVHMGCGMWGVIAAAWFDWGNTKNHFHGWSGFDCMTDAVTGECADNLRNSAMEANLLMIAAIVGWAGTLSGLTFFVLMKTGMLRIDEDSEEMGMDAKAHSPSRAYSYAGHSPKAQAPAPVVKDDATL